jgi:hypothetical protein
MEVEQLTKVHEVIDMVLNPPKNWVIDPSSKREVVFPRQMAHWICYYYTNNTIKDIAFYFGRRGHEVVNHSVLTINGELESNYGIACKVRDVCLALPETFEVVYPNGRYSINLITNKKNYSMPTKFAQPKKRIFRPKPVVADEVPVAKPKQLTLKQLNEKLEKETDIFVVMEIEKEIDRINWRKRYKPVVQHAKIFA